MDLVFVLAVGLIAGIISGIIGTGSSIMLVPVLAAVYGPKAAVPIMAVAALMANVSRVLVWLREVNWRAVAAYGATGVPAAFLGARTLLVLPSRGGRHRDRLLLLAMIPGRHLVADKFTGFGLAPCRCGCGHRLPDRRRRIDRADSVPVFVAFGLARGAFIGTEAAGSLSSSSPRR